MEPDESVLKLDLISRLFRDFTEESFTTKARVMTLEAFLLNNFPENRR